MKQKQSGQILLITLLVLAVASTIIIGLVGRSTTDTAITNQAEESSRAFSAAEAGVEQVLKSGQAILNPTPLPDGTTFTVATKPKGVTASGLFPDSASSPTSVTIKQGQVYTLWLISRTSTGGFDFNNYYSKDNISICWDRSIGSRAAIELIMLARNPVGSYYVRRNLYDKDENREGNGSLFPPGNFSQKDLDICSLGVSGVDVGVITTTLNYQLCGFAGGCPGVFIPIAFRIKPHYADTRIRVLVPNTAGNGLPAQGQEIESTGVSPDGTASKIRVTTSYRSPSTLFDYVLYSQGSGGLTK